jgi:hypothetical protein
VFSSQEEILPTYRHYSNWFEALRNVGSYHYLVETLVDNTLMLLPSCLLALLPQALHPLVPLCQVGWHFPSLSRGMLPKAAGGETAPPCR